MVKIAMLLMGVFVATGSCAAENAMAIGLIGDSTVATTYGWGPEFVPHVKEDVAVLNVAVNGATLESLSETLDQLLENKPDYVFVQFGHNDMKKYDPEVYAEKLSDYVNRIKNAGGKPVVFSSVTRRRFDEQGTPTPWVIDGRTLADYAAVAEIVAEERNVPFISLYSISVAHHQQIGRDASMAYNFEGDDTTHFSPEGAKAIALLIVDELKRTLPEVAALLK